MRSRKTGRQPAGKKWTDEKKAKMREQILTRQKTVSQLADENNVRPQRIYELVGNISRSPAGADRKRVLRRIENLFDAGKADKEIAIETGLSAHMVTRMRSELGLSRRGRRKSFTPVERIILQAQAWYRIHGRLVSTDWNPSYLRETGQIHRLKLFQESDAPHYHTVSNRFGSFGEMLRQAGIPSTEQQKAKSSSG